MALESYSCLFSVFILSSHSFIVDTKHNITAYLILYFPLTIVQLVYCVIYASIELLIIFLTNYFALYFKLIQIKLGKLDEKLKRVTSTEARRELIEIIKDHEMAINCVNDFEDVVKIVLLATFVMNSFIICFFIFAFFKVIAGISRVLN